MSRLTRRLTAVVGCTAALALVAVAAVGTGAPASASGDDSVADAAVAAGSRLDRPTLRTYAEDTYRSLDAMLHPSTALPDDNIEGDLDPASRGGYTSPTNIGAYLWSTVVAREIGLVSGRDAHDRMAATLDSVARLDRHDDSGMFYNWYDPATVEVLHSWPGTGDVVHPFLSSVDNGWMAAALMVVESADPLLADQARALRTSMDFGFYYDPKAKGENVKAGLIRGGFWDAEPPGCSVLDNYRDRGAEVWYTCHHYGALNSEPRIASYIGIATGQIPPEHYYGPWRTFPPTCDYSWTERMGLGEYKTYLGVEVFEGAYPYRGARIVPSWGGDMFEAFMPGLFVPEATWGPRSWGVNHPLYVRAQIQHGMDEAGYGYWGFSPSSNPAGGYREYGVDALGMDGEGYTSDQERTTVTPAYGDCLAAQPEPASYGDGVVTPHAVFLGLEYAPEAAQENLANLRADFDAYGPGGFYDAIGVRSGTVATRYLSLDQGMVMGALGNVLADDVLREYFVSPQVKRSLEPLLRREEFGAGG
ncbi:MAG: glucoamylase family protein [Actinomycetes bacterium]